jgi:ketosteroid isomerase-like protein
MRRRPLRFVLAAAAALPLAACGGHGDQSAEKARLMQTSRDWSRAAEAGNVDAILNYWSDDALVISPGEPPLRGKAALRTYLERSMKTPGFRIRWEPLEASLSADGSMGYLVERTEMSMTGPDGRPVRQSFRGVTIWRKQPDGSWKNVVDISNSPPPVRPQVLR